MQAIDEDLSRVEPVFEKLVDMVHSLLDISEPSEDRKLLEQKLDDVKIRWYSLREKTPERAEQILQVLSLARKYGNIADTFTTWLEEAERRIGELDPVALGKAQATHQAEETRALRDGVLGHRPELKDIENVVDGLVKTASADHYIVEAQVKDLAERYERLLESLENRERLVESVKAAIKEYYNSLEVVERIRDEAVDLAEAPVIVASSVEKMNDDLRETKVTYDFSRIKMTHSCTDMAELAVRSVRKVTHVHWLPSPAINLSHRPTSFGMKISKFV